MGVEESGVKLAKRVSARGVGGVGGVGRAPASSGRGSRVEVTGMERWLVRGEGAAPPVESEEEEETVAQSSSPRPAAMAAMAQLRGNLSRRMGTLPPRPVQQYTEQ